MDSIQDIAISKIADILSSSKLLTLEVDIWKKIFNNAGLSEYFQQRKPQFTIRIESYGGNPSDVYYYNNERCYNGLHETFMDMVITNSNEELFSLLNNIVCRLNMNRVFKEDIEDDLSHAYRKYGNMYLDDYLKKLSIEQKNEILMKYPSKVFMQLRTNVNILGLDICFDDEALCIMPFTGSLRESSFDNSVILQWLSGRYENIAESYIDAMKAYSVSDEVGCIAHCRNIITGIFTYKKAAQRKWLDGMQKVCCKDKNILNVPINKIPEFKYNANAEDVNARYQYPRYNLIYKLYSYTCALGAHKNEGNVNQAGVEFEDATLEDAFFALRMTEDLLIWLYQTNAIE